MKGMHLMLTAGALVAGSSLLFGQTTSVRWWALDGAYQQTLASNVTIRSLVGQTAPGVAQGDNIRLAAGFLADTTFRGSIVTVKPEGGFPVQFAMYQNYPNPFNPSTTIKYELSRTSDVRLSVFDLLGREVSVLVNERSEAGVHEVKFDRSNLASGVYFYRLQAGNFVQTRKLLLLR